VLEEDEHRALHDAEEAALVAICAEARLRHLRSFGIGLALDDFGSGYSGLSYLRRMPFESRQVIHRSRDDRGVRSFMLSSHWRAIGLKVTAEGVETSEQQQFLRLAGCHYLEGYLFSKPVPPAEIDAMLAAQQSELVHSASATSSIPKAATASSGAETVKVRAADPKTAR
jgi:EAL domain-containing protein (putative c-di-GMP-specific phosphodiesterase class I)